MKAARWHNQKDIRIENIDEPKAEPVKSKLKSNGAGFAEATFMNIWEARSLFRSANLIR